LHNRDGLHKMVCTNCKRLAAACSAQRGESLLCRLGR
jgi:hypothetical protein